MVKELFAVDTSVEHLLPYSASPAYGLFCRCELYKFLAFGVLAVGDSTIIQ